MKTIAPKMTLLALAVAALATSGCSFDSFMSSSSPEYGKPADFSQDVDSLPDPDKYQKTNADRVTVNNIDSVRRTESPERLLMQAEDYFGQNRYHDSARLYKKYLTTSASKTASPEIIATAHYRIGFVASKRMQYQEACREYRQSLQIEPFNNDYLFAYAQACYEAGDFATAEEQFAQLTSRAPGYPNAQYYYGLALLESGDRSRALQPLTAAKGDLEAYFLLADKRYAKGELQLAIQAENQMNQIAASLNINPPELPHKSRTFRSFPTPSTSAVTTTLASVQPQNVGTQSFQGNSTPTTAVPTNVGNSQVVNAQPSATEAATVATSVPSQNVGTQPFLGNPSPTTAANVGGDQVANVQPSTSERTAANASNVPNVAAVPQTTLNVPSTNTQLPSQSPAPGVVPQLNVSTLNPQIAANANSMASSNERGTAAYVTTPTPENVQSSVSQEQRAPNTTILPPSVQTQTSFGNVQNVPNQGTCYPQNNEPIQAPTSVESAAIGQTNSAPNTTTSAPQNVATVDGFTSLGASSVPATQGNVPIDVKDSTPIKSWSLENSEQTTRVSGKELETAQVESLQIASLKTKDASSASEEENEDDDWSDDDFAFACSGQTYEPTPTASLIASESLSANPLKESTTQNEGFSEYQQPGNNEISDALIKSGKPDQNETLSQIDQTPNQKFGISSVEENGTELAQSVVSEIPESPRALEIAPEKSFVPEETEHNEDNLASSVVDNSAVFESTPSPLPNSSEPSFIDFRPGSTIQATIVTVEPNVVAQSVDDAEPVAIAPKKLDETLVKDYNVPQFPSTGFYDQRVPSFEQTPSVRRTFTIGDMERLASDWASLEQIMSTYLSLPTPNVMVAQAPNVVPQTIPQTFVPTNRYNSPEEFFRSTPQTNESLARQESVPSRLANETAMNAQPSEISRLQLRKSKKSTPEERLQAARAAGAEVIELTPEQYRQAVLMGTSRK